MNKSFRWLSRRLACCVTVVAMVAVVTTLGVPAGALEAGTGRWSGSLDYTFSSSGVSALPPCGLFSSASANDGSPDDITGTYTATNGTATVSYSGDLNVTWTALESYYAGPHGIYADPLCTRPKTVLVSSTVSGSSGGVSVSCSYTGQFTRRDTTNFVNALNGTCTLTDTNPNPDVTITTMAVETRVAQFTSCTGGGPPSACESSEHIFVSASGQTDSLVSDEAFLGRVKYTVLEQFGITSSEVFTSMSYHQDLSSRDFDQAESAVEYCYDSPFPGWDTVSCRKDLTGEGPDVVSIDIWGEFDMPGPGPYFEQHAQYKAWGGSPEPYEVTCELTKGSLPQTWETECRASREKLY